MAVISDENPVRHEFPLIGEIISLVTSLATVAIIAVLFLERFQQSRYRSFSIATYTLLIVRIFT
jgi:hypothetical protein